MRWLVEQEPGLAGDIFLDLDPQTGIRPGQRWKQALQQANSRCEAVICLLSADWVASHECKTEFRYAETLNKAIVVARLEPVPDHDVTSEWQRCDLFLGDGPATAVSVDAGDPVVLSAEGLNRLLNGLRALGIGADHFPWPPPSDPERAPYRGWAPLDEADAAVFFGRDAQIVRGLEKLRGMRSSGVESLLVILGPSGCGKSSFLRAGLLPRVRRDDRKFLLMDIVRPERAALTGERGLAQAISALRTGLGLGTPLLGEIKKTCLDGDFERLRSWLAEARSAARARLLDMPSGDPAPTLVLPLDQGEELFSADAGPQGPQFLGILAALLRRDAGFTPGLLVAVTIRADRYEPLQTAPQLSGIQSVVFDELKPMPVAGYTEVITGPARRAGAAGQRLRVDPALVERLLADSAGGADALPLLALTLQRLYRDFGGAGQLRVADYESMGGVSEVVQTEVDSLFAADPNQRQSQLELLHDAFIPFLATINRDNDQALRRLARYTELPVASLPLIETFVEKRLLAKDPRDGAAVVEVALESLLRQWRELAAWLRAESQDLKAADALEIANTDWHANDHNPAWLLGGTRLIEAETLIAKPGFRDRLSPTRDFLIAARADEDQRLAEERQRHEAELRIAREKQESAVKHAAALRKRSLILRGVLAGTAVIAVVAVVASVLANDARQEANDRTREVIAQRLTSEGELMLPGVKGGGDVRAFQQMLAAQQIAPKTADKGALYTALVKLDRTLKIIETPASVTVAFSKGGKRIAVGSADNSVRVWDAETGKPIGESLSGHTDDVRKVAITPDGKRIASSSKDRTVRIWDVDSGQAVGQLVGAHQQDVWSVAFSPDGKQIVTGGNDHTVRLWDTATGMKIGQPFKGHDGAVKSVAFSPDGKQIVSGSDDYSVRVWDAATGQPVGQPSTGHTGPVRSVAFSPDSKQIVSGSDDFSVRVWDAATGQPVGQPFTGHTGPVWSVAFGPDKRIVSGSDDNTVRMWDAGTGQPIGDPFTGHQSFLYTVAFSPNGHRIFSGGADDTVRVWDADTDQPMIAQPLQFSSAAISPDGKRIVTGSDDNTVRLWDTHTGQPIGQPLTGHQQSVLSVAFSRDGHRIASASADNTVRLWNADTRQPIGQPLIGHRKPVWSVAFSPDGKRLVSGGADNTVRLWDADTRQPIGDPLTGHENIASGNNVVSSVAFSPDGKRLVSGGADNTVRLWDADTRQPIGDPLIGHRFVVFSVAFSPDGHRIASGSADNTVRLWDADTRQPIGQPLTGHQKPVYSVAFSPDGHRIASGSADNTVRLWDADTRQPIGQPLTGHHDAVWSVAFSPDAPRIVSGGLDGTVRVWPAYADAAALCAKLTSNMSHRQWRDWVSPNIDYIEACPGLTEAPD